MSSPETQGHIKAIPLNKEAYLPYGKVIRVDAEMPFKPANFGTAKRYNHLCELENLRPEEAKLNLCIFRCSPLQKLPLELKLLEKHHLSTQVFIPLSASARYLAIVCLGGDKPDLSTLGVFLVEGSQGISYYPGVWHYPMTALDAELDFCCMVHEDGSKDDCVIEHFEAILIDV
jgi:ureidoglycolate lyase